MTLYFLKIWGVATTIITGPSLEGTVLLAHQVHTEGTGDHEIGA